MVRSILAVIAVVTVDSPVSCMKQHKQYYPPVYLLYAEVGHFGRQDLIRFFSVSVPPSPLSKLKHQLPDLLCGCHQVQSVHQAACDVQQSRHDLQTSNGCGQISDSSSHGHGRSPASRSSSSCSQNEVTVSPVHSNF